VHGPLVVPEAALLGRPVVALVTGEGDETVLRHLVHLQAVGLGRLVIAMGTLLSKSTALLWVSSTVMCNCPVKVPLLLNYLFLYVANLHS